MSDGGTDATLGHRPSTGAPEGQRISTGPEPAPGAAPWERFAESTADHNIHRWQAEPAREPSPSSPSSPSSPKQARSRRWDVTQRADLPSRT